MTMRPRFSNQHQHFHITTMTSTSQLFLGSKLSKSSLKACWLKYNHDSGYDIKFVSNTQRPKSRYFSVCYTVPKTGWKGNTTLCRAHVKAVGTNDDLLNITSIDLMHTYERSVDNMRKRNYLTRDICEVSDVLKVYQPAKAGNAKQFAKITKTATGVPMKNRHANLAVKSSSHDTIEAQIGQYFWLKSLLRAYKESDEDGSFVLEYTECTWREDIDQFYQMYCCLSIAKNFWSSAGLTLVVCNGTFTRNNCFKQIVLIAASFDANNQIVILAFAIVEGENADNWVRFKEQLKSNFPGINVWMTDTDKGICSNAFSMSKSQSEDEFVLSRCARHLAENCHEYCKQGTMNKSHKTMIVE
jgi:Transposase, Mutator family